MSDSDKSQPLTRTEATMVVRWLRDEKEKSVDGGWTAVYKKTPDQVATAFGVKSVEVISAARRDVK